MAKIKQVQKADGSLVPFRERKIYDALILSLRASGIEDPHLAEGLCGAILHFLEKQCGEEPPLASDIEDLLIKVLRETGHAEAALHHETIQARRRELKDELVIVDSLRPSGDEFSFEVDETSARWDRAALEAELEASGLVPVGLADEIVTAIESILINGGLRIVSRRLLAELRDSELTRRGFSALEPAGDRIEVHRSEIEKSLDALALDRPIPEEVAKKLLSPWALRFLHGGASARAHSEGRIHLHGLEDPYKIERLVLPAHMAGFSEGLLPGSSFHWLLNLQMLITRLEPHVRSEISFPDLVLALGSLLGDEDPKRLASALLQVFDRKDAFGRKTAPMLRLCVPLSLPDGTSKEASQFCQALIEALSESEHSTRIALDLVFDARHPPVPLERIRTSIELARRLADARIGIARPGDAPIDPLIDRRRRLKISVARIAVNLPLVLLDLKSPTFDGLKTDLVGFGSRLRAAFVERYWSLRKMPTGGLLAIVNALGQGEPIDVPAQGQDVDLDVWGLLPALDVLIARGILRPAGRPEAAAALLQVLDQSLGAENEDGISFRVQLGGPSDRLVRARLLSALQRWSQETGLAEIKKVLSRAPKAREHDLTLPVVLPLLGGRNEALLRASFANRLGPGLALPYPAFETEAGDELLLRLSAETELGRLSFESLGGETQTFEQQEELFA